MTQRVETKRDAIARIRYNQAEIRRFGVKRMALFGSFTREQQKSDSDIDLLVEFEKDEKTFDNFMALCFFLEDVMQRPIELVTPESLSPYIGPHILAEVEYVNLES